MKAEVHRRTQRKQVSPDGWTRCCDLGSQRLLLVQPGKFASLGASVQDFSHQTSRARFQFCLPGGAALRIITLRSERKISVPGFQQELLELVKGTSLLKSQIQWQSFRTAVKASLRWPENSVCGVIRWNSNVFFWFHGLHRTLIRRERYSTSAKHRVRGCCPQFTIN